MCESILGSTAHAGGARPACAAGRTREEAAARAMPISGRRGGALLIHIAIHFTAGQYSARPWGVKEGYDRHEWPPSPYRVVRAAAAAWKYNLPDIAEDRFYAVVRRLASELPVFGLPRAGRMAGGGEGGSGRPAPWRIDPGQAVHIVWPSAALAGGERRTLSDVLAHVHYLGRTESWCEMRLGGGGLNGGVQDHGIDSGGCDQAASLPCRINCRPYDHEKSPGRRVVPARVIVPRPDVTMEDVYRKEFPSDGEAAGACPDGGTAVPYLIDREAAGPRPAGEG